MTQARAFSSEVETGSRKENASYSAAVTVLAGTAAPAP